MKQFFGTVQAVFFDRDDTLIVDVPYNNDPDRVEPMPYAVEAVELLRRNGIKTAVISNQSGVGRGKITKPELHQVNQRVEDIFGRFDAWRICPHTPEDHCRCRKPHPTLLLSAAKALNISIFDTFFIGDIGSDLEAALNSGSQGIMVPTARTLPEEIPKFPQHFENLMEAVEHILLMKESTLDVLDLLLKRKLQYV